MTSASHNPTSNKQYRQDIKPHSLFPTCTIRCWKVDNGAWKYLRTWEPDQTYSRLNGRNQSRGRKDEVTMITINIYLRPNGSTRPTWRVSCLWLQTFPFYGYWLPNSMCEPCVLLPELYPEYLSPDFVANGTCKILGLQFGRIILTNKMRSQGIIHFQKSSF